VGEAGDGAAGGRAARELRPDVVLIDIRMQVMDGLAATKELLALPEPPQVAVLTTFHFDEFVYAALAAGAAGFLLKDTPPRDIAAAVRAVADGTATLSPKVTATLIESYVDRRAAPRRAAALQLVGTLSDREREVLALLCSGGVRRRARPAPVRQRGDGEDVRVAAAHQAGSLQPHAGGDPRPRAGLLEH
jgi:DNA-binding NarL/FixJ family response regulator